MPPVRKFTAVSLRDTYPPTDVPSHHVYMAFNIEADATAFRAWWAEQGAEVFEVWRRSRSAASEKLLADIEAAVSHDPEPFAGVLAGGPRDEPAVIRMPYQCGKCGAFKFRSPGSDWYCPRCER